MTRYATKGESALQLGGKTDATTGSKSTSSSREASLTQHWDHPDPFVVVHEVSSADIDELGHANNVCYPSWLERCAWEHSAAVGYDVDNMLAINHAMVVRETRMQYLLATFAQDRLHIGDWIVRCDGKLRATRGFQIIREQDLKTVMRAEIDYVCINIESGRPSRMPPEFVVAYTEMRSA